MQWGPLRLLRSVPAARTARSENIKTDEVVFWVKSGAAAAPAPSLAGRGAQEARRPHPCRGLFLLTHYYTVALGYAYLDSAWRPASVHPSSGGASPFVPHCYGAPLSMRELGRVCLPASPGFHLRCTGGQEAIKPDAARAPVLTFTAFIRVQGATPSVPSGC